MLQRTPTAGRGLARLIEQCLERAPRKRPDRGREVADRLRALLAEVGITQIDAELAAFARDRTGYERDFGPRIIPPLLTAASTALEQGHAARAADLIDRVLGIDEQRPEARALLARLESTERRGRAVRGAGLPASHRDSRRRWSASHEAVSARCHDARLRNEPDHRP